MSSLCCASYETVHQWTAQRSSMLMPLTVDAQTKVGQPYPPARCSHATHGLHAVTDRRSVELRNLP